MDLVEGENLSSKVDFEVLTLSIIWHDVWKATRTFSPSVIRFWFDQMYEGIGSTKILKKYARDLGYKQEKVKQIALAIRFHPGFEYALPARMWFLWNRLKIDEAKILRDLDVLESSISIDQLENFKANWFPIICKHSQFKKIWSRYYRRGLSMIDDSYFNYEWSKEQYKKHSPAFAVRADEIIEEMLLL
ncbi:hypothetical protein KC717_01555 [Candidatus Dojkabacteria bacterium]|uniref:HD domain-containing protein n=1 Tax=Candidatus Dojkabacteria bacterium TaxID=2099670 RepID=A0A955L7B5_9BACT|nr:hypothetical protein [Candidatus Dojkabacteria bacterium]